MDNLTFVAIDTETTGLSYTDDRIIQIGFSVFIKGVCVDTTAYDIYTDVPNTAVEINNIGPNRIANGYPVRDVLVLVQSLLSKRPRRFLLYNSPFDLGFVGNAFVRDGIDYDFRGCTIIDPLVIWRRFHPFKRGTLSYVAAYYGIPYNDEHDAGIDAAAAGHIYCQMYSQHGELRNHYSNKMFEGWYNRWAGQFINYLRSKDIDYDLNDFQWPCRKEWICSDISVREEALPLW